MKSLPKIRIEPIFVVISFWMVATFLYVFYDCICLNVCDIFGVLINNMLFYLYIRKKKVIILLEFGTE